MILQIDPKQLCPIERGRRSALLQFLNLAFDLATANPSPLQVLAKEREFQHALRPLLRLGVVLADNKTRELVVCAGLLD